MRRGRPDQGHHSPASESESSMAEPRPSSGVNLMASGVTVFVRCIAHCLSPCGPDADGIVRGAPRLALLEARFVHGPPILGDQWGQAFLE